jgi:DNA-binding PadR family transcriptional regulator
MSNIYYHFEKMAQKGMLQVSFEKEGRRPDRQVYSITPVGEKAFSRLLLEALKVPFDFESIMDGPLFFSEYSSRDLIIVSLETRISQLEVALDHIDTHRKEKLSHIPKSLKKYAVVLFDHHKAHYLAELNWARKAITAFKK